jgi:hypothetical protein
MKPRPQYSPAQKAASLALMVLFLAWTQAAQAGGPLVMGSAFISAGIDGQPYTWSTTGAVQYRTDGGNLGSLTNATALTRVLTMFQAWQDVPTASISYNRAGQILNVTGFSDGDVSTVAEFNAVEGACGGTQSPIIFDTDGSIFSGLGQGDGIIGFAGPCSFTSNGRITGGIAALSGKWIDGNAGNGELTNDEFDAAFIHEFGHFSGLDHTQINVNCLGACTADELEGLPTMFPILVSEQMKTLSDDDRAWISKLYPETVNNPGTQVPFATSYGLITGTVFFSDGASHAQGVNVIARRVDDGTTAGVDESRRNAVSVVSGYRFTDNPGQNICCDNAPGSDLFPQGTSVASFLGFYEISVLPGDYTIEVEEINSGFDGGSGIRPLNPPFPLPGGTPEFWNDTESASDTPATKTTITVGAGATVGGKDIILNNTDPRFDQFEDAGATLLCPQPFLRRERHELPGVRA